MDLKESSDPKDDLRIVTRPYPSLWLLQTFLGMVCVWAMISVAQATFSVTKLTPLHTLNPNQAHWWELAQLPRLGPATSRAIVTYRESQQDDTHQGEPTFQQAEDLESVRGIGPRTVERIKPHLHFDPDLARF